MTEQKQVIIYSSPACHFCKLAKRFFKEHNITYTDYNVLDDEGRHKEMIEKSGQIGTPVIFIGEEMVVGFDESKVSALLGISEK